MPTDIDFNRIENNQKNIYSELDIVTKEVGNIKTADQSWAGLKTFNIISTPTLDDISGDITLGGIAASSLVKGRTYIIEGRSVVFSASAFNYDRANPMWKPADPRLFAYAPYDMRWFRATSSTGILSGNITSNFSGDNLRVRWGGFGAYVTIINTSTGTTIFENHFEPDGSVTYHNCGVGNIYYSISPGITISFRRCKYPISEDTPITAYDTNYNPAPSRKITLADIDAFRVG